MSITQDIAQTQSDLTRATERRILMDARLHCLEACATWLLVWNVECGKAGSDPLDAQFFLQRAVGAAKQAGEYFTQANGGKA